MKSVSIINSRGPLIKASTIADPQKMEHGRRMIYAGLPSFFGRTVMFQISGCYCRVPLREVQGSLQRSLQGSFKGSATLKGQRSLG